MKQLLTKTKGYFDKTFFTYFAAGALSVSLLAGGVAVLQEPAHAAPAAPSAPQVANTCPPGKVARSQPATSPTSEFSARINFKVSQVERTQKVKVKVKDVAKNKWVLEKEYTFKKDGEVLLTPTLTNGKYEVWYKIGNAEWGHFAEKGFQTNSSNIVYECLDQKYPYDVQLQVYALAKVVSDLDGTWTGMWEELPGNE